MNGRSCSVPGRCSRLFLAIFSVIGLATSSSAAGLDDQPEAAIPAGFRSADASVNGTVIHYSIGGQGPAVVLLHGYAETGHMWGPLMPELARTHTVIVPDLRGAGGSAKPLTGYDKKSMAVDIHELVRSVGVHRAAVVGHDIGLMVAYAYAAQFPGEVERLVLMDAFLPGIGEWTNVWLLRDLWHFHFYGETPLALVKGREREYFEHFWNDFAADAAHSVSEADRRLYAAAYAQEGGMRAGFEYFRNFEKDAADFAVLGSTKLGMPVLVLAGEKASGPFLAEQARLVATDVRGEIVKGAGHWLMEEAPGPVMASLAAFLGETGGTRPAAAPVASAGVLTFADESTLIVSDWRGGRLHALHLPPAKGAAPGAFNLKKMSGPIAKAVGSTPAKVHVEDMAVRPGAEMAYLSLRIDTGATPRPAIVWVTPQGGVGALDLDSIEQASVMIPGVPSEDKQFWGSIPEAALTVTSMVCHDGKLYVAGLSNATFASTLRVYDLPLTDHAGAAMASVEMYHAVHNQIETRAPIRAMAVATLNGEPSLVAAYTCTPLVTIALKDLLDGAHVTGKTIAELGWGSAPLDMVTFDAGQGSMVLLTNSRKAADLMSVAAIAQASAAPGLSAPTHWPDQPLSGLRSTYVPMAGVVQLDNQDGTYFTALRRDESSGELELVSIRKGAFLRLSDFINEYDFADYAYGPGDTFKEMHRLLRTDEGFPDLARRAAP